MKSPNNHPLRPAASDHFAFRWLGHTLVLALLCVASSLTTTSAWAAKKSKKAKADPVITEQVRDGEADTHLIEIYKLIGAARLREALPKAQALVTRHPNFQLAQLIYGDLLAAQARPLRNVGDVPDTQALSAKNTLADLREESRQRIRALQERPPAGAIPTQFLQLSSKNKHAIAVDAARSRLYLFENVNGQLHLRSDYYISVGKAGTEKVTEGDLRTPLGVYFVMGSLPKKTLKEFYGSGAMPLNYPNPYDTLRGKTGGGIWLHGTPPEQFSRAPKASDGCIVLTNPDLQRILNTVEARTTPVIIAPQIQWVSPQTRETDRQTFLSALSAWKQARTSGQHTSALSFYTRDFKNFDKDLTQWSTQLATEVKQLSGQSIELKDLSILNWKETSGTDTMVVTFGEVVKGARTGTTKRQYWIKLAGQWKIFFEGNIG